MGRVGGDHHAPLFSFPPVGEVRAHDGDAVVARVGGEVLVRLLSRRGAQLALTPSAAGMPEVVLGPTDDFAIVGTVAGVIRPFHDEATDVPES